MPWGLLCFPLPEVLGKDLLVLLSHFLMEEATEGDSRVLFPFIVSVPSFGTLEFVVLEGSCFYIHIPITE